MQGKPRYVERQKSGDGWRWYWRPKDRPCVALGDNQFLAWQEAERLNLQRDAERAGKAGPPKIEGTVRWLVQAYLGSTAFAEKADRTKSGYTRLAAWLTSSYGELACEAITVRVVQTIKEAGSATPWETNAKLRFLGLVYAWGRTNSMVGSNPADRFKKLRTPPRGVVWSPDEVQLMLTQATPSMRVAVALGLYTLQREGDLIVLPWSAVANGRFELRQRKTGHIVAAELMPALRQALDVTPRKAVQILVAEATGQPYREDHFRHVFAHDRARLGIRKNLQFRDLRRTGAVTLARLGVATPRIAALGGWNISTTQDILKVYIPLDEEMATAAVRAWAGITGK